MTDRVNSIRAEIKMLRKEVKDNIAELGNSESERIGLFKDLEIYDNILSFIDSLQEEPKGCMYARDNYTDEDRKVLCEGCEEECEFKSAISVWHDASEKPKMNSIIVINNDQTTLSVEYVGQSLCGVERWAYIDTLLKL